MKQKKFNPPLSSFEGPVPEGMQIVDPEEKNLPWAMFGGAFNPPTMSHEWIVGIVLTQVDRLIVVPSFRHPFKGQVHGLPFEKRVQILKNCLADWEDRVLVSEVEKEMGGVGYTVEVLEALQQQVTGGLPPIVVIGEDLLGELHRWHRSADLLASYRFLIMPETGLHATLVREAMERGESVEGWLSDAVIREMQS